MCLQGYVAAGFTGSICQGIGGFCLCECVMIFGRWCSEYVRKCVLVCDA